VTLLEVDARQLRSGVMTPPISKSDAIRALTLAAIRGLPPPDVGDDPPEDVAALRTGLAALGKGDTVDCRDGAGPFRVLLGQAAVRGGRTVFTGSPRLGERPHAPLRDALLETLEGAGLRIESGAPWPWIVDGTDATTSTTTRFRIRAEESSQFATSLLLAASSRAQRDGRSWEVELEGSVASRGYFELTMQWLSAAGFRVETVGPRLTVSRGSAPALLPRIPADWSSAAYLLIAAWRSGGKVVGLDPQVRHPDKAIARLLGEAGLEVHQDGEGAWMVNGEPRAGLSASAAECPDLIPALAALACVLPEPSTFTEIEILREKESDRVGGAAEIARAGGAEVKIEANTLKLSPRPDHAQVLRLASHGDHRQAMAATTLAVCLGRNLLLEDGECVRKSFPSFFEELSHCGVVVRPPSSVAKSPRFTPA
jgi:3-phosphoshikimate 1-carboxyvinyltransferase